MIVDKNKTYRTRGGREVRIYALDGAVIGAAAPVHGAFKTGYGWECTTWHLNGQWKATESSDGDLIEADPHGILPRHREMLADALAGQFGLISTNMSVVNFPFEQLDPSERAALIALAKLDAEKGGNSQ